MRIRYECFLCHNHVDIENEENIENDTLDLPLLGCPYCSDENAKLVLTGNKVMDKRMIDNLAFLHPIEIKFNRGKEVKAVTGKSSNGNSEVSRTNYLQLETKSSETMDQIKNFIDFRVEEIEKDRMRNKVDD